MGNTTISVPEELADELYERKGRGESYADVIWRLLEDDSDESAASGASARPDEATTPTNHTRDATPADSDSALSAVVDDVADEVLPGSGAKLEARRDALHAVVDYLREHGEATPADFRADVYPDHPARYTEADDPPRSWWKNSVYKGLAELADRADEIEAADTSGTWSYSGEAPVDT